MNKELIVLQLHYYLKGENNHSMDASIHNECERYFVQGILSLNREIH